MSSLKLPSPGNIDLWQIHIPDLMPDLQALEPLLSPDEKARAYRFKFPVHRDRFIITHAILRKLLGHYTRISPEKLNFCLGPKEKPFLQSNKENLQFNLSHSGDFILIAVTKDADIGVDIEQIRTDIDVGIAERFFHANEKNYIAGLTDTEKAAVFFRFWAGKEAILKMTGKGLSGSLADFFIDPLQDLQSVMLADGDVCRLAFVAASLDYMAAVACSVDFQHIRRGQWTMDGPVYLPHHSAVPTPHRPAACPRDPDKRSSFLDPADKPRDDEV